ncbi:hypothetical protein [Psychromonas ingrahamii]|uniref:hypothetical protein n=1 Tax=Psychromonas ingrahamii TaxID=357794 RepID=UPI00059F14C0|nr:hypothetical protein [Psychromonas ingrahamii]
MKNHTDRPMRSEYRKRVDYYKAQLQYNNPVETEENGIRAGQQRLLRAHPQSEGSMDQFEELLNRQNNTQETTESSSPDKPATQK